MISRVSPPKRNTQEDWKHGKVIEMRLPVCTREFQVFQFYQENVPLPYCRLMLEVKCRIQTGDLLTKESKDRWRI